MHVCFSHGHRKNGQYLEWWWANGKLVQIVFDAEWFNREGSINDLKQMVITKAKEA